MILPILLLNSAREPSRPLSLLRSHWATDRVGWKEEHQRAANRCRDKSINRSNLRNLLSLRQILSCLQLSPIRHQTEQAQR